MTTKLIIIIGISIASVIGMFAMGYFLNKDDNDNAEAPENGKE